MSSPSPRRPCPFCAEMIVATAIKCRFCGEDLDDDDQPSTGADATPARGRFPLVVQAAGIVWIVIGLLVLLGAGIALVDVLCAVIFEGQDRSWYLFSFAVSLGIGVIILRAGVRSARGSARSVIPAALGSLLLALFTGASGGLLIHHGIIADDADATGRVIGGGFCILGSLLFFIAASLATVGHARFNQWRKERQHSVTTKAPSRVPTNVSGWSLASCYVGLVSVFLPILGALTGLLAVLFGVVALATRKAPGIESEQTRDVRAVLGIVAGTISTVLYVPLLALMIIGLVRHWLLGP